jgi:3-oxoacyl-[acyl-carrier-protein] synthase II
MSKRIAVSGVGLVSALGCDPQSVWSGISSGKSAVSEICDLPAGTRVRIGSLVGDYSLELPESEARKYDPFILYAYQAASSAIKDSGLTEAHLQSHRCAVLLTSGIGGLHTIQDNQMKMVQSPRRVSPFFIPGAIINLAGGLVASQFGLKGVNFAPVSACASSAHSIAVGAMLIETGQADVVLVGGSEAAATDLGIAGFASLRALSTRNDEPKRASRPWDKNRDGFVISDGAAVMVLESEEHLLSRQGKARGYLSGYGMTSDGYHITQPHPEGMGAALAMKQSMAHAGLTPDHIDYVNAHATSTPLGDSCELHALHQVFGQRELNVSSTKSMHGHMLGAAGAYEAVICLMALQYQVAPPTINLDDPEDSFGYDLIAHQAKQTKIDYAMSNSFGFGGTNVSLIFQK